MSDAVKTPWWRPRDPIERLVLFIVSFALIGVVVLVWKIATGRLHPHEPTCADFADVAREKVPARCFRDYDPNRL